MNSPKFLISTIAFSLLSVLTIPGCTVFNTIGDALDQFYENSVSYFNAYYNASRLFREVEAEMKEPTASQKTDGSSANVPQAQLSPTGRQKLTIVIDKCSNILAFHPSSSLVDDALLLTGKSYYYLGEFAKAERKFTEVLAQYPNSPLVLESQLWLVRSLLQLKNDESAVEVASALVSLANEKGEKEIAGETFLLLGEFYSSQGNAKNAIENYEKGFTLIKEGDEKAATLNRIGGLWHDLQEYQKAVDAYQAVRKFTSKPSYLAHSGLQTIRTYRTLGQFESSLAASNSLLRDFRLLDFTKEIEYERASTLLALGRHEEALDSYVVIDTTSARTEIGGRAAYASANLLEKHFLDYASAAKAYGRAAQYNLPDLSVRARQREQAIAKYFMLTKKWALHDSLIALPDSIFTVVDSSQIALDSHAEKANVDTLKTVSDSAVVTPVSINRDSLYAEQTTISFDLAELFYTELENPDSALFWYDFFLKTTTDSTKIPRALLVVAELQLSDTAQTGDHSRQLYQRLVEEFPLSPYTIIARQRLGIQLPRSDEDPAQEFYGLAERKLDEGKFREAVKGFSEIVQRWPDSPLAPKSAYAIGWIFEYKLNLVDSAVAYYKKIIEQYGSTPFAQIVRERIGLVPAMPIPPPTEVQSIESPDDESESDLVPKKNPATEDSKAPNRKERSTDQKKIIKD